MSKRKHISWKTKCAATLFDLDFLRMIHFGPGVHGTAVTLDHAKEMTEDQYLSLWHFDHNKLHAFEGGDHFSNLSPMPIKAHRIKTKTDAKIIAKSKRIRANSAVSPLRIGLDGQCQKAEDVSAAAIRPARTLQSPEAAYRSIFGQTVFEREAAKYKKLQSRGFDKTKTKGFDGKVRDRK